MRALLLISLLLLPGFARSADSLSIAQSLYADGLTRLALARVVRDQPQTPAAADWTEWESLRLTLLSQLGQTGELLDRVKLAPRNAPKEFVQKLYGHAAWAHLERNEGVVARAYLARLLWQFPLTSADHQWARRLVIQSYLVEHKSDEAYRAMLRYQQDFSPLPKDVAMLFVQGLLGEGEVTEAMTWVADLDPASAASLRLQLRAGLLEPAAAMKRAQAAARTRPAEAADYAGVVADAAKLVGNERLRIQALEDQLDAAAKPASVADELWRTSIAQGEAAGNRAQLLQGDDASWLSLAAGTSAAEPEEGRAIYAYVVARSPNPETRELALSRLFASLAAAKPRAAVRLAAAAPWGEQGKPLAVTERLVNRVAAGMPAADMRPLWLAASRVAADQQRFDLAADYCMQAVLASDGRAPDALANEAVQAAQEYLQRAGFPEDAEALKQRLASRGSAGSKKQSTDKAKRKK
jgi:hypothetical protein